MNQVATLTTGWEPDTPLDDSVLRQFVFAYADRVAWMAQATHGRVDRDAAACIADAGSAFGYDTGGSASWTSCASRSGNTNQPNLENQIRGQTR